MSLNYGKIVRLIYDGPVKYVSDLECTTMRLRDWRGKYYYPLHVTYGESESEVYLHFSDINNLAFPCYLDCLQTIKMGSDYVQFGAFVRQINLPLLWYNPMDREYLDVHLSVTGTLIPLIFSKRYTPDGNITLLNISTTGDLYELTFKKGYFPDGYMVLSSVDVTGQYCDINGNPL